MTKFSAVLAAILLLSTPVCAQISTGPSGPYANASRGQLPGTATNDNASAGNIGEYIESVLPIASAVSLTSASQQTVTSISLTAGDWDVTASLWLNGGATTSVTFLLASISTTTNIVQGDGTSQRINIVTPPYTPFAVSPISYPIGPYRISLSGPATIFLVADAGFTVSTTSAYGTLRARRER